jgi:hypothetical protein
MQKVSKAYVLYLRDESGRGSCEALQRGIGKLGSNGRGFLLSLPCLRKH